MERVKIFLSSNPVVVLVIAVVGLLSGIVTIATSWTLFSEILLNDVRLPGWLIILALLLFFGLLSYFASQQSGSATAENIELELIEGKQFGVQRLVLDGKRFVNCKFDGTELIIEGKQGFGLVGNHMKGVRLTMSGAAGTTLQVLNMLYQDPSFRPSVEKTFAQIISGEDLERSIP
ncbi:hypothetical protein IRZ81_11795 [Pseudomonas putida]|uniref:hypothetical protein n=1 Tax=Pseudomonas putida TaxID=303 RepID=UPI0018A91DC4|nr:hypothetical protein [Pseudomonas putida]MBF8651479.1 hypothetical protein [Pseudomonas putida]MBF8655547.1 hypothetical protein [Pseudomonas putida]